MFIGTGGDHLLFLSCMGICGMYRHECRHVCMYECTCVILHSFVSIICVEAGSVAESGTHDSVSLVKQLASRIPDLCFPSARIACQGSGVHLGIGDLNSRPYACVPNPSSHLLAFSYYYLKE